MDHELESDLTTEDIAAVSGLTPEQLAEVPDINGGLDDAPASAPAPKPVQTQTPAKPAQTPTPAQAQTIREAAAAYGLDLSQHPDDHAAFVHLIRQAQMAQAANQNRYYTDLGMQLAPRLNDIQGFLRTPAPAPVAKAPEAPKPWQPPEFSEQWLNLVEQDQATGVWRSKPGINPEYAEKVQKYADWMQGFNKNPMALISQAIKDQAGEEARRIVAEHHTQTQETATIGSIIEQNASWVYQTDAQGRRYVDQAGNYVPTPEGARYATHLQTLARSGVRDPKMQDQIARQLVQGEIAARSNTRQTQVAATQTPQARAAQARPPVNAGQAVEPTRRRVVPAATEPSSTQKSMADLLRESFAEEGISDADFALG